VKKLSLLTAVLSAGALFGQAPIGEARIQLFGEFLRPADQVIARNGSVSLTDQADAQTGLGIRIMGEIPGTTGWYYQLGGRLSGKGAFNKTSSGSLTVDATDVDFLYSYFSVGGSYLWNFGGFTLGSHLEGRSEALKVKGDVLVTGGTGSGGVDHRVSYLRPWFRLSGDWSFKAGGTQPFLGLDAAVAITKTSQNRVEGGLTSIDDRNLKAMAPNAAFSVYVGLRF